MWFCTVLSTNTLRKKNERSTLGPVSANFDPNDFFVVWLFASAAVVAKPAALRHVDVETLAVEGSWT